MASIHCFSCNKQLKKVFKDGEHPQPYGGAMFYSSGNYGSTVWDPMGAGDLLIIICDECIVERSEVITEYPTGSKEGNPWTPDTSIN